MRDRLVDSLAPRRLLVRAVQVGADPSLADEQQVAGIDCRDLDGHAWRAVVTSGRSCSAARANFFYNRGSAFYLDVALK